MMKSDIIQNVVHCINVFNGAKNIDIFITDYISQLTFDEKTYLSDTHFTLTEIIESIGGAKSAYYLAFSKNELQQKHNIYQIDVLMNASVKLIKYDIIKGRKLFVHDSVISGVKTFGDHVISSIKSTFKARAFAKTYSPLCRAEFCDSKCGLNIADHSLEVEVIELLSNNILKIDQPVKDFDMIVSQGLHPIVIQKIEGNSLYLKSSWHFLKIGQKIMLKRSCDKKVATCIKYNNAINFRAEPYINDTINFVLD